MCYRIVLTVRDLETIPLKHAHAHKVTEALLEVFTLHGVTRQLLSDQEQP